MENDFNKNNWLSDYKKNVTSQFGEDGIIEKIFEVIGVSTPWCVELGALNGTHHSNTWNLIKNNQWSGVLIEADPIYFERLQETYKDNPRAVALNQFISFEGEYCLDKILSRTPIPRSFDFFSLDIDGNDFHIWDSLDDFRPRVIVVEFNPSIPDDVEFVQPRDMRIQQGSSLLSLVKLGKKKGYELIAATPINAFFVEKELYPLFKIADNSPLSLRQDHSYESKFFQLYDGTLILKGCDRLIWHKKKIEPEAIQILPPSKRHYPGGIHPNRLVRGIKAFVRRLPFYGFIKKIRAWVK